MACKYPDRWLDYSKYGAQVQGTQFVALKVPLGKKYFIRREEESFTPNDAIDGISGLGLVIDLTFTTKYYSASEFEKHNVQYKKIFTKGHEIPKRSLVNQFIRTVNDFLADEQNKDKLIGVHCTHGLNRTGYFICAYMILVQGQAPKSAIQSFNEARAHAMERANYLNSLMALTPLSYNAHDDHGPHKASDSRNGYRDCRSKYNRREGQHRWNSSQENHNGYYRAGASAHRDRSCNWRKEDREDRSNNRREEAVHEDRPNNWRKTFFREDQRSYRNYRDYNRWRDSERYEDHRNTPRDNGVEACTSSNGDHQRNRLRWVRKESVE